MINPEKKERIGWYFYDFANSAFYTSVITVFLGPYLTSVASNAADSAGNIYIFGLPIYFESYFPYLVSFSVLLQVFFLPILGAVADYSNKKKSLLGLFAYVGAVSTSCLYFLEGDNYLLGGGLFVLANLGFGGSVVMYNAYLNDIAEPKRRDTVSSNGWALGYLGGGIVLALNLVLYSFADSFGISEGFAVRISLSSAGIWWGVFTLLPMLTLKVRRPEKSVPFGSNYIREGFSQFFRTLKDSRKYPKTLLFLFAYIFYNDGVQTVIAVSSQFGSRELGLDLSVLTTVILMVQFAAFFGSVLFKYIARSVGTKNAILISLVIWIAAVVFSYLFLRTELHFYILGFVIAVVLGGTQALSRSLYSKIIPPGHEAEYFGLYEISERGTSWLGPFVFGLSLQLTGSYRYAILSLAGFFIIGFFLLLKLNVRKALRAAGQGGIELS